MGNRWILRVTCPECGFVDDDVYYAPTCGFVEWKCPKCGHVVDLQEETGISPEDASNAKELARLGEALLRGARGSGSEEAT